MSSNHTPDNEPPLAKVINIQSARGYTERRYSDRLNFAEMTDGEIVEVFFSQMSHPSVCTSGSNEIGLYVQEQLSRTQPNPENNRHDEWRERILHLMSDSNDIEDSELDTWAESDVPFAAIESSLIRSTSLIEEMANERKALRLLWDLRIGLLHRAEVDESSNTDWMMLIRRLTSKM